MEKWKVTLRPEKEQDHREVEELTRDAFWNLYVPGCDEHYLCHLVREHQDFLPDLDYVAVRDGKIVGSIVYTKATLVGDTEELDIVSFGPFCVHPDFQRQGIGTALIEKTTKLVQQMNIPAIVIYGDPHNYCRHGFKNGIDYQVSTMEGEFPLGLLVLETRPGFFGEKAWKVRQSDVFEFDHGQAVEFDKSFQEKEKRMEPSQVLFQMLIRASLKNPG